MRIIYVITGLNFGGAEVQLLELSSRMRNRGHDVRIVSVMPLSGLSRELEHRDIPVETLGIGQGKLDLRAIFRLAKFIRKVRPNAVHSFMVHSNLLTRITRLFATQPVLINTALGFSESRSSNESSRLREFAYRISDWLSDTTTQVSRACAERYVRVRAVPKRKIRVIPSGVDSHQFRTLGNAERIRARLEFGTDVDFRWLTVGRLVNFKDQVTAVRAFARIEDTQPSSVFVLRGDGPEEEQIRQVAEECGVKERVRILLNRCDIMRLMNGVDAFVLSSISEGMPTAALEAAACGLPLVVTDVGGNREVVIDGVSGFVVPSRDPDALAEAMLKVMKMTDEERHKMGLAGRRLVETKYDFEIVASQYERLYEELGVAE